MKKFLPILSMAFFMVACSSNPKDVQPAPTVTGVAPVHTDTIGLAQFQAWKVQNELAAIQQANQPVQYAPTVSTPVRKKTTYKTPVVYKATKPVSAPSSANSTSTSENSSGGSTASTDNGSVSTESTETAKAPEKTGISKAAKGAAIGGVVGAGAGAVIFKNNRALGAVIGGVIGAGGGYAIGRKMDKKDGRY